MSMQTLAPPRVLIVDDDAEIRAGLADVFARAGFSVSTGADVPELEQVLAREGADVIVLDLMLPGEDGLAACRRLAGKAPPIIMLSALGDDADRIVGLEIGADDYLAKPCNPRELVARVRALLRRVRDRPQHAAGPAESWLFGGFRLDMARRELTDPDGVVAPLSGGEFRLLRAFLERPQRVLSRDTLLDLAFSEGEVFDRAVDVQVSRLRRKLEQASEAELIRTVRGEGYLFTQKPVRR
ncbi:MAG: response regulator [Hyphomonadaceae bacterium]|nr:response regulator [Hyphomonadaceae bacterium]